MSAMEAACAKSVVDWKVSEVARALYVSEGLAMRILGGVGSGCAWRVSRRLRAGGEGGGLV